MEQQLSFVLKLSLEEMALRRSVINLWSETDVLSSIEDLEFESLPEGRETLNGMVKEKISNLVIPEPLKKRMMIIVKPIGAELARWKTFHKNVVNWSHDGLGLNILKQLCWTPAGTVDYPKSAEKLLRLDALGVQTGYKLASLYCLVNYIPELWDKLPRSCKKRYLSKSPFVPSRVKLDVAWAYLLTGQESTLDSIVAESVSRDSSFQQLACEYSALSGNKGAAEYFFKKLSNAERNSFLVPLVNEIAIDRDTESRRRSGDFPIEKLSEVLCYFLSQMSPEQHMQALRTVPCELLGSFLDWPLQDLCLEMADLAWQFLTEQEYYFFIETISKNIEKTDHYFPDFLQKLYLNSPSEFKSFFVDYGAYQTCFFPKFFDTGDTQTIQIIFRNLEDFDKIRLVYGYNFFRLFDSLLLTEKRHLIKMCLEEALKSENHKILVEKSYMQFLAEAHAPDMWLRKRRWRQIFLAIDKILAKTRNKRAIIEEIVTESKKCCKRRK
ncbi:uncharacterized protein LOC129956958 [Argiope bruennichi]|uniref:uncharacterized protein LOC129956958 n=1 Tax=Argiope bruennichi TaxID=94029 RepID=UPI002495009D|nr:uncharacterized protein LOC129956958 [Argiope bruennichi]XP_055924992.1 uncharacterized protein LOC129956958 [Argiope bruennichi]